MARVLTAQVADSEKMSVFGLLWDPPLSLDPTTPQQSCQRAKRDLHMSKSDSKMYTLPLITVQHDINTVIDDIRDGSVASGSEDAWISCYLDGHESVHGKLHISKEPGGVMFEARQGVQWQGSTTVSSSPILVKSISGF